MNLSIQILLALVLSVAVGLGVGPEGLPFVNKWIAPIGTIFINFIKMMIVPVVFCSLIVGVTSLGGDGKKLGRISAKTICLYLITTAIAIVLGFAVAGIIHPGAGLELAGKAAPKVKEAPTFMQVLVNMVPTNPIESMAKAQILPIIIFALFVGVGITQVGSKRSNPLIDFFDASAEVCSVWRVCFITAGCLQKWPESIASAAERYYVRSDRLYSPVRTGLFHPGFCRRRHFPVQILPRHVRSYDAGIHNLFFCCSASG